MDAGEYMPHPIGFTAGPAGSGGLPAPVDFARRAAEDALDQRANRHPAVGEVTALTVLTSRGREYGGEVQIVQASTIVGGGYAHLTGQHGREMDHSLRTAHDFLMRNAAEIGYGLERIRTADLAVHLVSIGQYREGSSAGLAFLLAMVSALLNRPLRPALAVTGEVSLHGDIGAVGGLPFKLAAAQRRGRRVALIPEANRAELEAIPARVRGRLEILTAQTVRDALRQAFVL